ncbi:flagellin N-terminal helical domain-containing protein [Neorhizobium galegae]|uniref:Flagellin n=2 Tax=Neorhizobium galegae TaxID=399 RepID=A0A068SL76_NEOGA|nr:flagellin [Neorhizobium galegae]CDN46564.1 Flagellin protein FlaD [Neorhizobium galegae bv. orientalis str. HAMBI 540]
MVSILTNTSAIAALQTLRSIGAYLFDSQQQVSSGLRVKTASDNAAYWSIATTMRSDNGALSAVRDALGLGAATVDTAYAGMEVTVDIIAEIKNRLTAAAESGVDRSKIQEEIDQLQDQLLSVANASSFAGENWLIGHPNVNGFVYAGPDNPNPFPLLEGDKKLVASFTRDSAGNASVQTIDIKRTTKDVVFAPARYEPGAPLIGVQTGYGIADSPIKYEMIYIPDDVFNVPRPVAFLDYQSSWERVSDDLYSDGTDYFTRLNGFFVKAVDASGKIDTTSTTASHGFNPDVTVASLDITKLDEYSAQFVGTQAPVEFALDVLISFVDSKLQDAVDVSAKYGALSKRIEIQQNFAMELADSFDRGVGRLVDADMNQASTRLKALQAQEQLATQALSIANESPNALLRLFQ